MAEAPVVRFGVLGAGRITQNQFVPALRQVPGAVLQAVASRERTRAQALQPVRAYNRYLRLC
jgi:predicted dehydrogenase